MAYGIQVNVQIFVVFIIIKVLVARNIQIVSITKHLRIAYQQLVNNVQIKIAVIIIWVVNGIQTNVRINRA